jgi:uncharacterized protein GlcG (DUF336 family)
MKKTIYKIGLFSGIVGFVMSVSTIVALASEPLPKQSYLPQEMAQKAAATALKMCKNDGYAVSVTVVDSSGIVKVVLRGDGAGPHTLGSSSGKAYTAASMKRATMGLANFIKDKPELSGLRNMDDRILILGGGLPINIGGQFVGGIGVGGAPGGHLDEACAKAGIKAITSH